VGWPWHPIESDPMAQSEWLCVVTDTVKSSLCDRERSQPLTSPSPMRRTRVPTTTPLPASASRELDASAVRPLCDALEARPCVDASHGNGVFARKDIEAGTYHLRDHAVCVASTPEEVAAGWAVRRLPAPDAIDELMHELSARANRGDAQAAALLRGQWAMSHVERHLALQGEGPEVMPSWAVACGVDAASYNLLASQLQSNLARHADGGGLILNPSIRLVNHACGSAASMELAWHPPGASAAWHTSDGCACAVGHYVLRARRHIAAGEEVTYSFVGDTLSLPSERLERRAILLRRWGFVCGCALCVQQAADDHDGDAESRRAPDKRGATDAGEDIHNASRRSKRLRSRR
jgi:hypothetical protein